MLIVANCFKRGCRWYKGIYNDFDVSGGLFDESMEYHACEAFPKHPGIPFSILSGKNLHAEVLDEQIGDFVFEKRKVK